MIKYISKEELDSKLIEYFKKLLEDDEITISRERIKNSENTQSVITKIHSKKEENVGGNCITLSTYMLRLVLNECYEEEGLKFVSHDDKIEGDEFIGMTAIVTIKTLEETKKRTLKNNNKKGCNQI